MQAQAVQALAHAIANYHEQLALDLFITPDFQKLVQQLAQQKPLEQALQQHQRELQHTHHQPIINSSPGHPNPSPQPEFSKLHQTAGDIEVAQSHPQTSIEHVDPTALEQQRLHVAIATALDALSDRDLYLLYSHVVEYFRATPQHPPQASQRQQVNNQIEQIDRQIERLYQVQAQQQAAIASMQKNLFHNFDRKYRTALADAEATLGQISHAISHKKHYENQLSEWDKQEEVYQAWKSDPKTVEMHSIATVLESPQMQQRLTDINLEIQRQDLTRAEALGQTQQEQDNQQYRQGRGR